MYPSCEQNFYHFSISIFSPFYFIFLIEGGRNDKGSQHSGENTPRSRGPGSSSREGKQGQG
jgi:hypothetical protein